MIMFSFCFVFRFMDIYFTAEETNKAIDDLAIDAVYDTVAVTAGEPEPGI